MFRPYAIAASLVVGVVLCCQMAGAAERYQLIVDYGDGSQKHFTELPWREGMTVLEATKVAGKHPRGINSSVRSSGSTAFLTKIDDVENEGGDGRNWVFRVNGELGDRSCGVYKLDSGDTVLWRFQTYE